MARSLTDRPFGVNVPFNALGDRATEIIDLALEERVGVVVTAAGSPEAHTRYLKGAGVTVIHVVASVKHAQKAEASGVDAIVVSGIEAGGFLSHDEITTFALVPQVVDCVKVPVIAAGGIADGRGMIAALALGAEGVQMGTRFIATHECQANEVLKEAVMKASDTATTVINRGKNPSRAFKPDFLRQIGLDSRANYGAGQIAGMIHEITSVREVIEGIISEARSVCDSITEKVTH